MRRPRVAMVNESSVIAPEELTKVVEALQKQINSDFQDVWGRGCHMELADAGAVPSGAWVLGIFDDSDQAGALGYHDTTRDGLPLGKIFAGTDKKYGYSWSVTASHELLEMLGDPQINLDAQVTDAGKRVAYELCDPCEADELGYEIDGVLVSDFVTPEWFMPGSDGPWDFGGHLGSALGLAAGGYISMWTPEHGWTQVTARKEQTVIEAFFEGKAPDYKALPAVGSRRERRHRGHLLWQRS